MSVYRREWSCCGSVTETDAWEPEHCPFCTPDQQPAAAAIKEISLPVLRDFLQAAHISSIPILLSHQSAGALYHAMTTGEPAADSRATGDDGEMPPLPWKGDYDAWYAKNKFHMHEAFEKYARTYGQQCRDAALERAEGICLKSSNEYLSHEELAAAIRALKGGK